MGSAVALPDSFKNAQQAQAFKSLGDRGSLADGIGQSYGVIKYKGKTWTLDYRGKSHNFVRIDDGTPASHIDVVILRGAPVKSKSFYPGGYTPGQSDGKAPMCHSLDGIVPDDDVAVKQCDVCVLCSQNEWKVDAQGKKGRACQDYKRLAVLIMPYQTEKMLGQQLVEPAFLRIPPASLNDLAVFGETMRGQGFDSASFITRITFDPDKAHPKMVFTPLQVLTETEAQVVVPMISDSTAMRITGEDQYEARANKPQVAAPAARQQIAASAPVTAPVTPAAPPPVQQAAPPPPPPPSNMQIIPPVAKAPAPPPPAPMTLTLTANPPPPPAPPAQAAPAAQTTDDTGVPAEADDDLNARIANLLQPTK